MPIARVNGIDTYYEDEGRGTPVLFIHGGFGGAESALYWKPSVFKGVLPPDRYRVITYDRRGCGRSSFVQGHYTLDHLAADARALMQYLGVEKAIVVGDSLGGMVAQKYALKYPEAVQSLLLVETGSSIFRVSKPIKATLFAARYLPVRLFVPLMKRRALEPEFYDPLGPLTKDEVAERRMHHEEYKGRLRALPEGELLLYTTGLLRNYAAFADIDLTQEAERLAMPIDIMHGTADKVVRFETGAAMHRVMPRSEFHALPGLGHGLFYYLEGRKLALQIIDKQVARQEPAGLLSGDYPGLSKLTDSSVSPVTDDNLTAD